MENMLRRLICISFWFRPPLLSKMKKLNQNILGKGLFPAINGHLCLTRGTLSIQKGWWRWNSHYPNMFFTHFIQIEKKNSKRALLTKHQIPGCFIFLKQDLKYTKITAFQKSLVAKERNKQLNFTFKAKHQISGRNYCNFQAETGIKISK